MPVIASHRINDPATARRLLSDGMCDMVAMGRSLIADPFLPRKTREGMENEIVHCVACAQGCFDHLFQLKHIECLCNPRAGHEASLRPETARNPKTVLVVGGGPAGMSAALAAAERGHAVTLYERSGRLGGQLHLAAAPPGRAEVLNRARDLEAQLKTWGVPVVLNRAVDMALITELRPDAVILATGAEALLPPIAGIERPNVVQAWDVLADRAVTGKRVVVVGGGAVGVETALFLAEKGTLSGEALKFLLVNRAESPEVLFELATRGTKEVTLIEMIDKVGKDIGRSTRWGMLQDLGRIGVVTRAETRVTAITDEGVAVEKDGRAEVVPADSVVLAAGSRSFNPLERLLAETDIAFQVVGDARSVGQAFDAVHQGYAAGAAL